MKRLLSLIVAVFTTAILIAQVPESFNYQAILRDATGNIRANASVSIDIAILQGSATGTQVFIETHSVTTNEFGLVNLAIGSKNISGFESIDWTDGPYFVKVSVDGTEMGTSQILSVPYALHSKTSEYSFSTDYNDLTNKPDFSNWDNNESDDFSGSYSDLTNIPANIDEDKTDDVILTGDQTIGGSKTFSNVILATNGINSNNKNITNVADPVNNNDAANKAYVDALLAKISEIEVLSTKIKDVDDNLYSAVKIGDQIWMKNNLKTTRYNDGTDIPLVTDAVVWTGLSTPAYCWYDNDKETYGNTYGALYNWYVVETDMLCPTGWHVPSDAEWTTLINYLDGESVAGGKLKETGYIHWPSPNTGATDESDFTALPGGYQGSNGIFYFIGYHGYWWSSSESNTNNAWFLSLIDTDNTAQRLNFIKTYGFSIRCIKD